MPLDRRLRDFYSIRFALRVVELATTDVDTVTQAAIIAQFHILIRLASFYATLGILLVAPALLSPCKSTGI